MKDKALKIIYGILAYYARAVIKKNDPFVVAITGSVGKTSTKEAIYQVLADHFGADKVRKNHGNLNAEIGIPLTILGYQKLPNKFLWPFFLVGAAAKMSQRNYPKYLVLEMGVEHLGDINYFCSIVKPNIAVITSVSPAHVTNFNSIEEYQKEKTSLIYNLKSDGVGIVNGDESVLKILQSERVKTVSLLDNQNDYYVENFEVNTEGTEFRLATLGSKISIKSRLVGKHLIYSSLFAFAVGKYFEFSPISIGKSLEKLKPYPGRMNILAGKNGLTIIDDTYNANPNSTLSALETLGEIKHSGRKVAIIGNMNELGELDLPAHLDVSKAAEKVSDLAVFAGPNAAKMASTFTNKKKVLAFRNRLEVLAEIDKLVMPGDLILIKASQNKNFFEEITKHLMKDMDKSKSTLVRQDKFWNNRKNHY